MARPVDVPESGCYRRDDILDNNGGKLSGRFRDRINRRIKMFKKMKEDWDFVKITLWTGVMFVIFNFYISMLVVIHSFLETYKSLASIVVLGAMFLTLIPLWCLYYKNITKGGRKE